MRRKSIPSLRAAEITPYLSYLSRRAFIESAAAVIGFGTLGGLRLDAASSLPVTKHLVTTTDKQTTRDAATSFNNFYEFGSGKDDPARNARMFKPKPWTVEIAGLCGKPGKYALDDILKPHPLEERVYRMRCVEGWSMVIPWVGFPLGDLLTRFEPAASAKFVEFTAVERPQEMPGQRQRFPQQLLPWPYLEGLRMDEAMHPLTILAVGLYGEELPVQNGAPLRLVVPWKYGFKGIKAIVKIRFADRAPRTTWQQVEPSFYSFYSNVNPGSTNSMYRDQSSERRVGEFLMRKTLMFNGYAEQVAALYTGLDLKKNY